jgi:SAM-dependent methyltransferase
LAALDSLISEFGPPKLCKVDVEGFEIEVLKGLSRPVPIISFELHRSEIDRTREVLARLSSIGQITSANLADLEQDRWIFEDWIDPEDLVRRLDSDVPDAANAITKMSILAEPDPSRLIQDPVCARYLLLLVGKEDQMKVKSIARKFYHAVLPERARRGIARVPGVQRLLHRFSADRRLHDDYYTDEFYDIEFRWLSRSAPAMGADMMAQFSPKSVIDVGCGQGHYLSEFRRGGVETHGMDLAEAGLRRCREAGLDVVKHDLTQGGNLPWTAELVYSFEVAEHLEPRYADVFVDFLTHHATRHIVITAAAPGQPGLNHFNCQPKSYWIERFEKRGFSYLKELTEDWERRNKERELAPWFGENLMVFQAAQ